MWDSWVAWDPFGWEDWAGRELGCFAGIGFSALIVSLILLECSMESW